MRPHFKTIELIKIGGLAFVKRRLHLFLIFAILLSTINISFSIFEQFSQEINVLRALNITIVEAEQVAEPASGSHTSVYRDSGTAQAMSEVIKRITGRDVVILYRMRHSCSGTPASGLISVYSLSSSNLAGFGNSSSGIDILGIDNPQRGFGVLSRSLVKDLIDSGHIHLASAPLDFCGIPLFFQGEAAGNTDHILKNLGEEKFILLNKNDFDALKANFDSVAIFRSSNSFSSHSSLFNDILKSQFPDLKLKASNLNESLAALNGLFDSIEHGMIAIAVIMCAGFFLIASSSVNNEIRASWHDYALRLLYGSSIKTLLIQLVYEFGSLVILSIVLSFALSTVLFKVVYISSGFLVSVSSNIWVYYTFAVFTFFISLVRPLHFIFRTEPSQLLSQ